MKILLIDNYDSFTFNLLHQLQLAGAECVVVRNDDPDFNWKAPEVDAAVLSPGPCTPKEAGWLLDFVAFHAEKLPMLGICFTGPFPVVATNFSAAPSSVGRAA